MTRPPEPRAVTSIVRRALEEDLGHGDVTTDAVVDPAQTGRALLVAREPLVLAGLGVAVEVFRQVDVAIVCTAYVEDGHASPGGNEVLAELSGPLAPILRGERVALNFLQRMSGIATRTRRLVALLDGTRAKLTDTRKTTPTLRELERYAVRVGGGQNHRFHLSDGVLVKDNHIAAAGSVAEATRRALLGAHHLLKVEVEVESLAAAHEAADAGARVLLLDNFGVEALCEAVTALRARPESLVLEASGRVDEATLRAVAASGVDYVSSGSVVHRAVWVDMALDVAIS